MKLKTIVSVLNSLSVAKDAGCDGLVPRSGHESTVHVIHVGPSSQQRRER